MKSRVAVIATAVLIHIDVAVAQIADGPTFSFDAFATVGVMHSDERQADFVGGALLGDGAGHSNAWSAKVDSRLGLQGSVQFLPRLAGVVQIIVEQDHDGRFTPGVEWANLSFDLTSALSVRAGRMVLPTFLTSEYRKVGYAIPWVRPPPEVYGLTPVTSIDGIQVSHRSRFGALTNTLRATYGARDLDVPDDGGEVEARHGFILVDTIEYGDTTAFAQYLSISLSLDSTRALFDGFRQFGAPGQAIAERYEVDGERVSVLSFGLRHDVGDWFVLGEWARFDTPTFIADRQGWSVTGGYRHGHFTPYMTLSGVRVRSNTSDPGLPLAGLSAPLAATASGLNAGLNNLLGRTGAQRSVSLGTRWDVATNTALKVQFDHLDLDSGSPGVLVNRQPAFRPGGSVSLFSLTLDFVY